MARRRRRSSKRWGWRTQATRARRPCTPRVFGMPTPPSLSPERERALVPVLLSLTAVTGLVDAVSVLGLGRVFTANMTGNVVFLGFAAAGAPGLSLVRSGAALLAFVIGAAIGGRSGPPTPHRSPLPPPTPPPPSATPLPFPSPLSP